MENQGNLEIARTAMILGIVAAATCALGIPGIILGVMGKKKVKEAEDVFKANPEAYAHYNENFIKAGRITSKVGFIVGIVFTVIWAIYIIAIIATAATMASMY